MVVRWFKTKKQVSVADDRWTVVAAPSAENHFVKLKFTSKTMKKSFTSLHRADVGVNVETYEYLETLAKAELVAVNAKFSGVIRG